MAFPERIVCLAAEVPEILFRLGALDRVVGISAHTTRPKEALQIPKVSGFKHGSVRRVLEDKPDVVILTSGVQKDLAEQLAASGATLLHFNPHQFEDLYDSIRLLGNLVNRPDEAGRLNEEIEMDVHRIQWKAQQMSYHPTVYFEEWMDPLICGTAWVSDLIELAGGHDVFREKSVTGRSAVDRIIAEADVMDANPDVVLASWCGKPFSKERFVTRAGYHEMTAVHRDHIYEIGSEILQFGPMLVDSLKQLFAMFQTLQKQT